MRITGNMLMGSFMRNVQGNLRRMEHHQFQLSTGRRFNRASDDPVGVTRSLQARTDVSRAEQYIRNVQDGVTWLTQSETTIMEINDLLSRSYYLAMDAVNGTKTPEDRQAIAQEAIQIQAQLVHAANANFAGRYLFGGHQTTVQPFSVDGPPGLSTLIYNGHDLTTLTNPELANLQGQSIEYEVGYNIYLPISFTGIELMGAGPDNLYQIFDSFTGALLDGTNQEALNTAVGKFQQGQSRILALLADTGGRQNRLELMEKRYEKDYLNFVAVQSMVEDVDYPKAVSEFKMAEIIYQSALASGARIIQPTLLDFLR